MNDIIIFTDGASKGNPGPGGWGAVILAHNRVTEIGGREDHTTNNRMELRAAVEALKSVSRGSLNALVAVYSDSKYLIEGITGWVYGWEKNGWQTIARRPVLNADLWKELIHEVRFFKGSFDWHYVGGHVGIPGNERVDAIASGFAEGKKAELYSGPAESYPVNLTIVAPGSLLSGSKQGRPHKAYSYVSEVEGVVLAHKTWAECESRVKGKKARFKKSASPEDEAEIIRSFSGKGQAEN